MSFFDRGLERGHIDLSQSAFGDDLIDASSIGLLVIGEVVLDVGDDTAALDAFDVRHGQLRY